MIRILPVFMLSPFLTGLSLRFPGGDYKTMINKSTHTGSLAPLDTGRINRIRLVAEAAGIGSH
jgi:hypothetical protein